jgi:hypothetical protein
MFNASRSSKEMSTLLLSITSQDILYRLKFQGLFSISVLFFDLVPMITQYKYLYLTNTFLVFPKLIIPKPTQLLLFGKYGFFSWQYWASHLLGRCFTTCASPIILFGFFGYFSGRVSLFYWS